MVTSQDFIGRLKSQNYTKCLHNVTLGVNGLIVFLTTGARRMQRRIEPQPSEKKNAYHHVLMASHDHVLGSSSYRSAQGGNQLSSSSESSTVSQNPYFPKVGQCLSTNAIFIQIFLQMIKVYTMCCPVLQTSCLSFDNANVAAIAGKLKEFNGSLEEVWFCLLYATLLICWSSSSAD